MYSNSSHKTVELSRSRSGSSQDQLAVNQFDQSFCIVSPSPSPFQMRKFTEETILLLPKLKGPYLPSTASNPLSRVLYLELQIVFIITTAMYLYLLTYILHCSIPDFVPISTPIGGGHECGKSRHNLRHVKPYQLPSTGYNCRVQSHVLLAGSI